MGFYGCVIETYFRRAPHPNYDLGPILAFDGPELGCYKTDTLDYCSESEKPINVSQI